MQVGVLPVVHGSALAGQGQSQALVTATIGEAEDQAKSEGITGQTSKQLMVQFGDRMVAAAEVSPLAAMHVVLPHSASLLGHLTAEQPIKWHGCKD